MVVPVSIEVEAAKAAAIVLVLFIASMEFGISGFFFAFGLMKFLDNFEPFHILEAFNVIGDGVNFDDSRLPVATGDLNGVSCSETLLSCNFKDVFQFSSFLTSTSNAHARCCAFFFSVTREYFS